MAWPSKSKIIKEDPNKEKIEFRIVNGKPTKMYVQGRHILGPVKEPDKSSTPLSQLEEKSKSKQKEEIPASLETLAPPETSVPASMPISEPTGEKAGTGLRLIPQDEVAGSGEIEGPKIETSETDDVYCPDCKSKNVDILLDLEKARRYRCKDCNETFAKGKPIEKKTENKTEIPNITITSQAKDISKEDITLPNVEESTKGDVETPNTEKVEKTEVETPERGKAIKAETSIPAYTKAGVDIKKQEKETSTIKKILDMPKEDTVKQIPKIEIPKIEIKIPNIGISKKADEVKPHIKTEVKIPNIGILKKADEAKPHIETDTKVSQPRIEKNKPIKEVKYMEDEPSNYPQPNVVKQLEELLNKKKISRQEFDELMEEKKFNESIIQAAKFAEETREQIPQISEKIEGVSTEIKDIEGRLSTVNNSVDTLCTGVDCIKTDVKKSQETQEALKKQMEQRFRDLEEKVQESKQPTFVCDSCGDDRIRPLDSYCPNCGSPIHEWNDDTGQPVKGWAPYWKRIGRQEP